MCIYIYRYIHTYVRWYTVYCTVIHHCSSIIFPSRNIPGKKTLVLGASVTPGQDPRPMEALPEVPFRLTRDSLPNTWPCLRQFWTKFLALEMIFIDFLSKMASCGKLARHPRLPPQCARVSQLQLDTVSVYRILWI